MQADVGRSGHMARPKPVESKGSASSTLLAVGKRARRGFRERPRVLSQRSSLLGINHFFSYATILFSVRGKYRTKKLGCPCVAWCRGRRAHFQSWNGYSGGGEGTVMSLPRRALPEKSKTSVLQSPRVTPEPGWPAGNHPSLKVRLLHDIIRTRVATCHPTPSQSVCP